MIFCLKIIRSLVTTNDHLLQEINKHRLDVKTHARGVESVINMSNGNLTSLNNLANLRSPSFGFEGVQQQQQQPTSKYHNGAGPSDINKMNGLKKQYDQFNANGIMSSVGNINAMNPNPNYNNMLGGRYVYSIVK
jgi:hypothetical protein